jgi:hypothetical protein
VVETYVPKKPCRKGHLLRYVATGHCVECARANSLAWKSKNPTQHIEQNRLWATKNPEKVAKSREKWRGCNRERERVQVAVWGRNNRALRNAHWMKRKAQKLNATPKWLTEDDFWLINEAYELAARRTAMFGFPWHVDHVIPLQGRAVSGLHVPWNLQVIPAEENRRKFNKLVEA